MWNLLNFEIKCKASNTPELISLHFWKTNLNITLVLKHHPQYTSPGSITCHSYLPLFSPNYTFSTSISKRHEALLL